MAHQPQTAPMTKLLCISKNALRVYLSVTAWDWRRWNEAFLEMVTDCWCLRKSGWEAAVSCVCVVGTSWECREARVKACSWLAVWAITWVSGLCFPLVDCFISTVETYCHKKQLKEKPLWVTAWKFVLMHQCKSARVWGDRWLYYHL